MKQMITMSQLFDCLSASLSSSFLRSHACSPLSLSPPFSFSYSLALSVFSTLIKHREAKVDAGKRKVNFPL